MSETPDCPTATMVRIPSNSGLYWQETTPHLKFIGGKLHQLFVIYGEPNGTRREWRAVPSEEQVVP